MGRPSIEGGPSASGVRMTAFGSDQPFTVGVEEELQIVDPETGELVSRIDEILGKADPAVEKNLQSELFQAIVETATDVCTDVDEVREEIARLRGALVDLTSDKGYTIAAASTHPTARWDDQDYTQKPRYKELIEEVRWPAKRELIFGQHVHVALENPQQAIFVNNGLRPFLPVLLALSANSPFWKGRQTGLASTRVRIFDALPRTGMPRRFEDFGDFKNALETLKAVGSIEDVTKIWWDVRPRPDLGTVEVRISDIPTTVEESAALAGLTQALVVHLARTFDRGDPLPVQHNPEVIEENRWRALRNGLDARLIQIGNDGGVEAVPMDRAIESMTALIEEEVDELGLDLTTIDRLRRQGTGARRQLEVYKRTGSYKEVVRDLVERTPP